MKLLLMQHGEALSKQEDTERPLSDKGCNDVKRIANFLRNTHININLVIHSGKKRAEQTAILMIKNLASAADIETSNLINPNDEVADFFTQLAPDQNDILVVGHLPFMSNLVSQLCCKNNLAIVSFQPGSIVCIENNENKEWHINWMIRPELL